VGSLTVLLAMAAAVALTLAVLCGLTWSVDRRDLSRPVLIVCVLSTLGFVRCEIGMLHAGTAAEYAQWVRWAHLPLFFLITGYVLLVRSYLGVGRPWLAWTIISMRLVVLACNFPVHTSWHFLDVAAVRPSALLNERIAVVSDRVHGSQWLGAASLILLIGFIFDACVQRWNRGGAESRHKARTIAVAIGVPVFGAVALGQTVLLLGIAHVPILASPWCLLSCAIMAFEFSREAVMGEQTPQQLVELRGELSQIGRFNAVGQLAAELVHQLSQPLTAINANVEAAQLHLESRDPDLTEVRSILSDVRSEDARAAEALHRIRSLATLRETQMQTLAFSDLMRDVIALISSEARLRHVALDWVLQPRLPCVSGDRVQISQVLANLIINAIDAVQTCAIDARQVVVKARTDEAGAIEVSVHDSGPGIPKAKIDTIFNPFVTTKSGRMGFGLTVSRAIVEAHGGRLWLDPETPSGTTFRFTLPRAPEMGDGAARRGFSLRRLRRSLGRMLVTSTAHGNYQRL
jgi:signal transduction histidine kinase